MIPNPAQSKTGSEMTLSRLIDAKASRVYAAWTQPELVRQWWKPHSDFNVMVCEIDLRVGGKYRIGMGASQETHTASGEYLEVVPNRRLVMTWSWEQGIDAKNTILTVNFEPVGDKTQVTIHHAGLPTPESAESHRGGWSGILETLDTFSVSLSQKEKS